MEKRKQSFCDFTFLVKQLLCNVIYLRTKFPPLKKGGQGGFLITFKNPPKSPFFQRGTFKGIS